MKRMILLAAVLSVGCAVAGWRWRFDEQFAAALNQGTPIPAVAWYKLDGNALDSSGNGYDGTWSAGESYAAGPFDAPSAAFSGANAVVVPHADALNLATGGTITAWAYVVDSGYDFPRIVSKSASTDPVSGGWEMLARRSSMMAYQGMQGSSKNKEGLVFSQWQHHAWSFDGTRWKFWLDGSNVYSVAETILPPSVTTDLAIGNNPALTRGIVGRVADVRIYNRAMSAANIARIMTGKDVVPIEELQ